MNMWEWINEILLKFRSDFKRKATFEWFCVLIVGFLMRTDCLGVTSIVRALDLAPSLYPAMLHFFRSNAWRLKNIRGKWIEAVKESETLFLVKGKPVLIGDGVKQAKEGKRMPCVKRLHQESENTGKAEFIHGHAFGAIGVLAGNLKKLFCVPLSATIHEGAHLARQWEDADYSPVSHVVQVVRDALAAARVLGDAFLLLDAYFLTVPLLNEIAQGALKLGVKLTLITRARKSCVAYENPPAYSGRGRPPVRGKAVKLNELFVTCAEVFVKAQVELYGRKQTVQYLYRDLLWGTKLYMPLRFVLVKNGPATAIFVTTDQTLTPEEILRLYGYRFKIETTFRSIKQDVAGFFYHFWSKAMPRLNRFSKKDAPDPLSKVDCPRQREKILAALKASERYVMLCLIATGLLQMISIRFSDSLQLARIRWLRTTTSTFASEATVRDALLRSFFTVCLVFPDLAILHFISLRLSPIRRSVWLESA